MARTLPSTRNDGLSDGAPLRVVADPPPNNGTAFTSYQSSSPTSASSTAPYHCPPDQNAVPALIAFGVDHPDPDGEATALTVVFAAAGAGGVGSTLTVAPSCKTTVSGSPSCQVPDTAHDPSLFCLASVIVNRSSSLPNFAQSNMVIPGRRSPVDTSRYTALPDAANVSLSISSPSSNQRDASVSPYTGVSKVMSRSTPPSSFLVAAVTMPTTVVPE